MTLQHPLTFVHLNDCKRLPIRDYTERKSFLQFHDRLATACGLAMQGLGDVPLAVDLLPQEKPSFLSKLKRSFRKKQVPAAWGFDFGRSCVKAVRLTFDEDGVFAVDECFHCYHPQSDPVLTEEESLERISDEQIVELVRQQAPKSPFADDGPSVSMPLDQSQFHNLAIESFLSKYEYQGEAICVGYPGQNILCANISLPQMPPQQTWQAVQYESKHHLPENPNLFQTDYLVLGWEEDEQNVMKQYIHLFSSRIGTIENLLATLQQCGIAPTLMTSNVLANLNYAYHLFSLPPVAQPPFDPEEPLPESDNKDFEPPEIRSIMICDMGTLGTNLTFYSLREIRHYYLNVGGQHFTKSIAKTLGETFQFAEAIKRDPTKRAEDTSKVVEALKPVAKQLIDEILLRLTPIRQSGTPLDKVVVLGGGFQLKGFAAYFKSLLKSAWNNAK